MKSFHKRKENRIFYVRKRGRLRGFGMGGVIQKYPPRQKTEKSQNFSGGFALRPPKKAKNDFTDTKMLKNQPENPPKISGGLRPPDPPEK